MCSRNWSTGWSIPTNLYYDFLNIGLQIFRLLKHPWIIPILSSYRYDREVNLGHRSAIKRIVEGDVSPASAMVLCISAIHTYPDLKLEEMGSPLAPSKDFCKSLSVSNGAEKTPVANIELTDGWWVCVLLCYYGNVAISWWFKQCFRGAGIP